MTPEELAKVVEKATPDFGRERMITSRRYNLEVFRMVNGEKKVIETMEYLTLRQARELKAEYLRENNLYSDIIEDVTTDRDGNELTFPARNFVPEVKGIGGFGTPEATQRIIDRQRMAARKKASFIKKANRVKNGSSELIRYTGSFSDPKSPLYPMYLDNVKRRGFTVINKVTREKFIGLQAEVAEYIFSLLKSGFSKNDLDISFNGV